MNETAMLSWLERSAYGQVVRDIPWMFPALETLHFIGLSLMLGSLLLLDLRLLGVTRQTPIGPATHYVTIAVIGFAVLLVTGIGFFCADPFNYASNWSFKLKMGLVILGGLNALGFEFLERRKAVLLGPDDETSTRTKAIAALSLSVWFTVLGLGRLLPYLGGFGG